MNTKAQTGRLVILAAIEGGDVEGLVTTAARFAAQNAGGELHLVHVMAMPPAGGPSTTAALELGRAELERAGLVAGKTFGRQVIGHLTIGDPAREVLQLAAQLSADAIVVGTHGRTGIKRMIVGSVAESVVRRASCPVVVVREKDYTQHLAPEIEPPCPDCLGTQARSGGQKMWCARHSQKHPHAHAMYEIPEAFAMGSSIIRPD
jgi:nucleotide-binding universal stress UspA family protein